MISLPSFVKFGRVTQPKPAQLMSMSNRGTSSRIFLAATSILLKSHRSRYTYLILEFFASLRNSVTHLLPRFSSRAVMINVAPEAASCRAVSFPIPNQSAVRQCGKPEVAPVKRMTLPVISTFGAGLRLLNRASIASDLRNVSSPLALSKRLKCAIELNEMSHK
jgi:hypothetical protein